MRSVTREWRSVESGSVSDANYAGPCTATCGALMIPVVTELIRPAHPWALVVNRIATKSRMSCMGVLTQRMLRCEFIVVFEYQ